LKLTWLAVPILMAAAYLIVTELIVNALQFVMPMRLLYGLSGHNPLVAAVGLQVFYGISEIASALVVTHLSFRWVKGDLKRHIFVAVTVVGVYVIGAAVWNFRAIIERGINLTEELLIFTTIQCLQTVGIFLIVAIFVRRRVKRASEIKSNK